MKNVQNYIINNMIIHMNFTLNQNDYNKQLKNPYLIIVLPDLIGV